MVAMTDAGSSTSTAPARGGATRSGRGSHAAVWVTASIFLAMFTLLASRMASGQDPALRARAAATPPPPHRVLVRRVIERRVIVHLPPTAPPQANSSSQQLGAGASPFSTAVTRTS